MQPFQLRPVPHHSPGTSNATRLNSDRLILTVKIATACRSELENLCIVHGITHRGQPTTTLREALKQRLIATI